MTMSKFTFIFLFLHGSAICYGIDKTKHILNHFTDQYDLIVEVSSVSIGEFVDVSTTGITNGQGLVWNSSTNRFEPWNISASTITITGTNAPATGGSLCLNASGKLSKCTSVVDLNGNCTCP